jgi:hypothetical protein
MIKGYINKLLIIFIIIVAQTLGNLV